MHWALSDDFPGVENRVEAALKDERLIVFTPSESSQNAGLGTSRSATSAVRRFNAEVPAKPRHLPDGGVSVEAGHIPVLVRRPTQGNSRLSVSSLISCVAIFLVSENNGTEQAISGLHFVTPDDGHITPTLQLAIERQVTMTRPSGNLRALLGTSNDGQRNDKTINAVKEIKGLLATNGVADTKEITENSGSFAFHLGVDGFRMTTPIPAAFSSQTAVPSSSSSFTSRSTPTSNLPTVRRSGGKKELRSYGDRSSPYGDRGRYRSNDYSSYGDRDRYPGNSSYGDRHRYRDRDSNRRDRDRSSERDSSRSRRSG
jgi:hypothetical protein